MRLPTPCRRTTLAAACRASRAATQQNQKLVDALKELAANERCTPAQLCLAWLLSRKPPVVPLVGNSKRKWLEENAKATELRPSEATLAALDKTFKPGATQGDRYAAPMMARLGL